jgi:hypothetical protein
MAEIVWIIAEEKFRGDLVELARGGHVWVLLTEHNSELYASACERVEQESLEVRSLSGFHLRESVVESVYHYLGTIEEHHGEAASDSPWEELRIIGVRPQDLEQRIVERELDVGELSISENGSTVVRRAAQPAAPADREPCGR